MTRYEQLLNKLSLKYNKPINVIKDIVESQFEFTKENIQKIDLNPVNTNEDLENMKTTFRFLNIGSLAVNIYALRNIKNNLKKKDIINFTFSTTDDLDAVYPGKAVRKMGFTQTTIMCLQEMYVDNSLNKCIRVLLYINNNLEKDKVKHIYLKKAEKLRKDLNFLSEE
jgi:chorismate mutase